MPGLELNMGMMQGGSDSDDVLTFNSLPTSTADILTPPKATWGTTGTFTRASASYLTDFEGITRKVESGSVGVEGSRVVTNLLSYSEDLSNAVWEPSNVTPTADAITYTATDAFVMQNKTVPAGSTVTLSATVRGVGATVGKTLTFGYWQDTGFSERTVTLTALAQRVSMSVTTNLVTGTVHHVRFGSNVAAVSDVVYISNIQLENVTAQTNQNPGEYVKTTTAAVTKCYSTTNANTVNPTTGVVTEATGTALPKVGDYPEHQTSHAYAAGTKIQVAGWWYTASAGTSGGTAPTWLTGKAGLVTVTDNDITWTLGGRLLAGLVVEPASTNKTTAYGLIPADTLGSELITVEADRTFASDTGKWDKGAGWTIADGVASSEAGTASDLAGNFGVARGVVYQLTYTLNITAGDIRPYVGGYVVGVTRTTSGTFTETVDVATNSTGLLYITKSADFAGSIDNISLKPIDWAVGTKSYHDGAVFVQRITGLTLSGDVAAALSIVTAETEIAKAGLANINPTYKVYKLDNSLGSAYADVLIAGVTGNTNKHSARIHVRGGSGYAGLYQASYPTITASASYVVRKDENVTPDSTGIGLGVSAAPGQTLYFLLPQLEELPYSTSLMNSQGATSTRAATVDSYQTTGNIPTTGPWTMKLSFMPEGVSTTTTRHLWSSYTDANNYTRLGYNGVILYLEKNVAGVKEYVTKPLVTVANTSYNVVVRRNVDGTFNLFVAGAKDAGGLGSELITAQADREFSSDTGWWNKGTGWSITDGVASFAGADSVNLSSTSPNTLTGAYRAWLTTFTISQITGGGFMPKTGGVFGEVKTVQGTYSIGVMGGGNRYCGITSSGITAGSIDNVSIKEIYNSTTATAPILGTTFQLGSYNSLSQFAGWLPGVSIYRKALTDSKCQSLSQ